MCVVVGVEFSRVKDVEIGAMVARLAVRELPEGRPLTVMRRTRVGSGSLGGG